MSANVETMAYRYADRADIPWHGLGAKIGRDEYVSAAEFQSRAGANWTVSKRPVWYRPAPNVPARCDEDHFVLQRDDNYLALSIVGRQYKPVQNTEVFHFFHEFCERGDMVLETGGILDEGRKAWALATLKEGFTLAGGDTVTGHLLLSDSRDGGALRAKFTPVRVVCANTLALAFSSTDTSRGEFRLNHRSKFDPKAAKVALGISHRMLELAQEQAQYLCDRSMSSVAFKEFLEKLFPPKIHVDDKGNEIVQYPRARDYALDSLQTQKGASMSHGTWWQGFNAITYMLDHNKNRISDDASRLNNSWFGAGSVLRQKALTTALEMAR
jgi:phage/plasmid-like protein (TIGR03299 family)